LFLGRRSPIRTAVDIGAVPVVFDDTHQPMAKADAKAGDVIVYAAHTPNGVPIPAVTHATVKAPSIPSGTYSYFLKFKHTGYVRIDIIKKYHM
jgi:hypothetical protein